MHNEISFTPYEVFQMILFICGAIVTISASITVLVNVYKKSKQPEQTQNERISALEKKVERFEQFFDNDNKRLIELEKGNRVTQQALLALLSHALNGNNTKELEEAKKNLQKYLVNKEA